MSSADEHGFSYEVLCKVAKLKDWHIGLHYDKDKEEWSLIVRDGKKRLCEPRSKAPLHEAAEQLAVGAVHVLRKTGRL